jgi:hypothetical protein
LAERGWLGIISQQASNRNQQTAKQKQQTSNRKAKPGAQESDKL